MKKVLKLSILSLALFAFFATIFLQHDSVKAKSSTDVQLKVQVINTSAFGQFHKPQDGLSYASHLIPISFSYQNANNIKYTLSYTDSNGTSQTVNVLNFNPTNSNGNHNWNLDLNSLGLSYGNYVVHAKVTGNGSAEDSISFRYAATKVTIDTSNPTSPSILVDSDDNVSHITTQVFDSDGKPIGSVNKHLVTHGSQSKITFDFTKFCPAKTPFFVEVTAYDATGKKLDQPTSVRIDYTCGEAQSQTQKPILPTINVPNTGLFSKNSNLSSTDLLLSSLIMFFSATTIALVIIYRRKNAATR